MAQIDGKCDPARNGVPGIGVHIQGPYGTDTLGWMVLTNLFQGHDQACSGSQGVLAHRHWHRPGMTLCARHGYIIAHLTTRACYDANGIAIPLQDWSLFDMGFEQAVIGAVSQGKGAFCPNRDKGVFKSYAGWVCCIIGLLQIRLSRKQCRSAMGKAGSFFIRPGDNLDAAFGFNSRIIQGAQNFQPGQNAIGTIIFSARGLGIQMTAGADGWQGRVTPQTAGKQIANAIGLNDISCRLRPLGEQRAGLLILYRQGLAIDPAFWGCAQLAHLFMAAPQTVCINGQAGMVSHVASIPPGR